MTIQKCKKQKEKLKPEHIYLEDDPAYSNLNFEQKFKLLRENNRLFAEDYNQKTKDPNLAEYILENAFINTRIWYHDIPLPNTKNIIYPELFSPEILEDEKFVKKIITIELELYKDLPPNILKNEAIIMHILDTCFSFFDKPLIHCHSHLENLPINPDVYKKIVTRIFNYLSDLTKNNNSYGDFPGKSSGEQELYEYILPAILENKQQALDLLEISNARIYSDLPISWQQEDIFINTLVNRPGKTLSRLPLKLRTEQICLLSAQSAWKTTLLDKKSSSWQYEDINCFLDNIRLFPSKYLESRLIADQLVMINGSAIKYLSSFWGDERIMVNACSTFPEAIYYANNEVRKNTTIINICIQKNGLLLAIADETLRDNEIIVQNAIKQNPQSWFFCSNRLKNTLAICKDAYSRNKALLASFPEKIQLVLV